MLHNLNTFFPQQWKKHLKILHFLWVSTSKVYNFSWLWEPCGLGSYDGKLRKLGIILEILSKKKLYQKWKCQRSQTCTGVSPDKSKHKHLWVSRKLRLFIDAFGHRTWMRTVQRELYVQIAIFAISRFPLFSTHKSWKSLEVSVPNRSNHPLMSYIKSEGVCFIRNKARSCWFSS